MKAYLCDKCSLSVTKEDDMKKMIRLDIATDRVGKFQEIHLCEKCWGETWKFIKKIGDE